MDHEFLYSKKGLFTYIGVIMCHHPHDPHFTPKILQYAKNKRVHTSCMKTWLIIAANIRNLSGCENKAWKKHHWGLDGILTHDLCDTGAVRYCCICSLEEHILVTMNIVVVVLNRSNELTTIERISLRSDLLCQTAYIRADSLHLVSKTRFSLTRLIDITFLSKWRFVNSQDAKKDTRKRQDKILFPLPESWFKNWHAAFSSNNLTI